VGLSVGGHSPEGDGSASRGQPDGISKRRRAGALPGPNLFREADILSAGRQILHLKGNLKVGHAAGDWTRRLERLRPERGHSLLVRRDAARWQ
jgi:hypothetical protein